MAKLAHAQWSSRMTFVLAAAGSAVGLGNIWKFPYMVGEGAIRPPCACIHCEATAHLEFAP